MQGVNGEKRTSKHVEQTTSFSPIGTRASSRVLLVTEALRGLMGNLRGSDSGVCDCLVLVLGILSPDKSLRMTSRTLHRNARTNLLKSYYHAFALGIDSVVTRLQTRLQVVTRLHSGWLQGLQGGCSGCRGCRYRVAIMSKAIDPNPIDLRSYAGPQNSDPDHTTHTTSLHRLPLSR